MLIFSTILAQDGGMNEGLFYVIAVLILSVVGAVFEKIKRKMADTQEKKEKPRPKGAERPGPAQQPRPARQKRPPVAAPARPVARAEPRPTVRRPPPARAPRVPKRPVHTGAPIRVEVKEVVPETLVERIASEAGAGAEYSRPVTTKPATEGEGAPGKMSALFEKRKAVAFKAVGSFRNLSKDEVRRAIVLNEILSPPLCLRDYSKFWDT